VTQLSLLEWLSQPSERRGIRFAGPAGDWTFWSYAELAVSARIMAANLIGRGLRPNDRVALLQGSTPRFVASFFATLIAGGVPAVLAPPVRLEPRDQYRARTAMLLASLQPAAILTGADRPFKALGIASAARLILTSEDLLDGTPLSSEIGPRTEIALVQFTSGSSGSGRAVRIPFAAVEANLRAIQLWLQWTENDVAASWLPLHHDMGLIGSLLGAVTQQTDLYLLKPEHFVRSPLRFLRCYGEGGASLGAMPNFALDYIVRRVAAERLRGLDFSRWRALIVGSERVNAESLSDFHALLAPFGFRRATISPAYGLAEATLAVTGLSLLDTWTKAEPAPTTPLSGNVNVGGNERPAAVVGCGQPLSGITLTIRGRSGETLPDGIAGEIVVRGPSVAAGYCQDSGETATRFDTSGLNTGDIGFMRDGQLFVCGRAGDAMKVRGRTVFAEDVEEALIRLKIPAQSLTALVGWHENQATAVILLNADLRVEISALQSALKQIVEGAAVHIRLVPRGAISRTSSGKVRRREMWQAFCEGAFDSPRPSAEESWCPRSSTVHDRNRPSGRTPAEMRPRVDGGKPRAAVESVIPER
jgi:acyl-CoA synthetase (AMP-forming)/AMP-acid ligase II